jgi:hypothetical protein
MLSRISTITEIIVHKLYSLATRNWNFSFFTCNGFRVGCKDYNNAEYSLRESVSAQGCEDRGFDSDPGRNLKKKARYSVS